MDFTDRLDMMDDDCDIEGFPIADTQELKPCPFCKGEAWIVICDDEGNMHEENYEDDPWSGLGYQIAHDISHVPKGQECPIATFEFETLGTPIYDSREEAIRVWNERNL